MIIIKKNKIWKANFDVSLLLSIYIFQVLLKKIIFFSYLIIPFQEHAMIKFYN